MAAAPDALYLTLSPAYLAWSLLNGVMPTERDVPCEAAAPSCDSASVTTSVRVLPQCCRHAPCARCARQCGRGARRTHMFCAGSLWRRAHICAPPDAQCARARACMQDASPVWPPVDLLFQCAAPRWPRRARATPPSLAAPAAGGATPLPPRSRPRRSAGKQSGRGRTSDFRGVSFHKPSGKWRVRIKVGSTEIRLGYFATELQAAQRYDEAARVYHGDDAWLNFGGCGAAAASAEAGGVATPEGVPPTRAIPADGVTHKAPYGQPASALMRASAPRRRRPAAGGLGGCLAAAAPAVTSSAAACSRDGAGGSVDAHGSATNVHDEAQARAVEAVHAAQLLLRMAA